MKTEYYRDTWHYKLADSTDRGVPTNTCDYWSQVFINLVVWTLLCILGTFAICFGILLFIVSPIYFLYHALHAPLVEINDFYKIGANVFGVYILVAFGFSVAFVIKKLFSLYKLIKRNTPDVNPHKPQILQDMMDALRKKTCKEIIFIERKQKDE